VKTLGKILTSQQIERLKQIKLQVAGAAGLSIAEVASALALTDQQREKLNALETEYRDKTHAAVQGAKKKNYKQVRSIMADMRAKHLEAAVQVLTPRQRQKFDKMRGPKIDMDLSKF
jgi:DNA-binding transcriptional MerR regulator